MKEPAPALLNDLYQLTMAQGYLRVGIAERRAVFELFFRRAPHGGTFAVAAGLEAALDLAEGFRFESAEIDYLRSLELLGDDLLGRLEELRFSGDIDLVREGTVVFPGEPMLRVSAPILEAQLLETPLLNLVGFATLVAAKAARVCQAAAPAEVVEFGCRRAQGPNGAITASRAAFVGGCSSTSNLEAGRRFGIPVKGTMAHSFVMAFTSELEAFRAYADAFPNSTVLLVDTYDTLRGGVPNAITVARELRARGKKLAAVRIDSGDLAAASRGARALLDAAGFPDVTIFASGDMDEESIARLRAAGAPIDAYGVGTRLAASAGDPALTCVYKLVAVEDGSGDLHGCMKTTDDRAKSTLPGVKQVYRLAEPNGTAIGDLLALAEPVKSPAVPATLPPARAVPLLVPGMRRGRRVLAPETLLETQRLARESLERIPEANRRLKDPVPYPVRVAPEIENLRDGLLGR